MALSGAKRFTIILFSVLVLGNEYPAEMSSICCVGQGPVVTLTPSHLDWGEVHLLQEEPKDVLVVNECPIPASCTCVVGIKQKLGYCSQYYVWSNWWQRFKKKNHNKSDYLFSVALAPP